MVYVAYERGYPQGLVVFRSRKKAKAYVDRRMWPRNWIVRPRRVR